MFENYEGPDECRLALVCRTLENYWSRREIRDIEEGPFHEAFWRVLFMLKEQKLDPVPFTWNTEKRRYEEVEAIFQKLLAEGALAEKGPGVYVYFIDPEHRENDGKRKIEAHYQHIVGRENLKVRNATDVGYISYLTRVKHEDSLKAAGCPLH